MYPERRKAKKNFELFIMLIYNWRRQAPRQLECTWEENKYEKKSIRWIEKISDLPSCVVLAMGIYKGNKGFLIVLWDTFSVFGKITASNKITVSYENERKISPDKNFSFFKKEKKEKKKIKNKKKANEKTSKEDITKI